jgi:hypothetical protein
MVLSSCWNPALEEGSEVEEGQELGVLEWAELHPYLPVLHRERLVAPCSGKVVALQRKKESGSDEVCVLSCSASDRSNRSRN